MSCVLTTFNKDDDDDDDDDARRCNAITYVLRHAAVAPTSCPSTTAVAYKL